MLLKYLTTDPEVLGVLSWASALITLLGFSVAIWQIIRARRAADAARAAAMATARRVGRRELLAKLTDAQGHLEAAQSDFARGEREATLARFSFAIGAVIDAREISRTLERGYPDLQTLSVLLEQLTEQVMRVTQPLDEDPDFVQLRIEIRRASQLLKTNMAQSRYDYRIDED